MYNQIDQTVPHSQFNTMSMYGNVSMNNQNNPKINNQINSLFN